MNKQLKQETDSLGIDRTALLAGIAWVEQRIKEGKEDCNYYAFKGEVEKPRGWDQVDEASDYEARYVEQHESSSEIEAYYGSEFFKLAGKWFEFNFEC